MDFELAFWFLALLVMGGITLALTREVLDVLEPLAPTFAIDIYFVTAGLWWVLWLASITCAPLAASSRLLIAGPTIGLLIARLPILRRTLQSIPPNPRSSMHIVAVAYMLIGVWLGAIVLYWPY